MKPRALDLFCGAGGASMGLHRAGFDVTGVDIRPQPRYPFRFAQADALRPPFNLSDFDFIWASPPCQAYSVATGAARARGTVYPDLVADVRALLVSSGIPYAIENVPGSPLGYYITLCGTMFGLRTYRHRRFETSWLMFEPPHPPHTVPAANKHRKVAEANGHNLTVTGDAGTWLGTIAMGIDWMNGNELSQAIPPQYAEFIGRAALDHIQIPTNANAVNASTSALASAKAARPLSIPVSPAVNHTDGVPTVRWEQHENIPKSLGR